MGTETMAGMLTWGRPQVLEASFMALRMLGKKWRPEVRQAPGLRRGLTRGTDP